VIVSQDLEVRAGARTLLHAPGQHLRVQPGDRIGLIGRNGAGKTTTMRILSGETQPYAGEVRISGDIGYLPQDSREGNIEQTARDPAPPARAPLDSRPIYFFSPQPRRAAITSLRPGLQKSLFRGPPPRQVHILPVCAGLGATPLKITEYTTET